MTYSPLGRPATDGGGPERYSVRLPLWIPQNVRIDAINQLAVDQSIAMDISGRRAAVEKRQHFLILRIFDIASIHIAQTIAYKVATGLMRLAARKGVGIQFSFPPSDVIRARQRGFDRESLQPDLYPQGWTLRADGTRTDGEIFMHQSCILPEHERIWECPIYFGTVNRLTTLEEIRETIESSPVAADGEIDDSVLCAVGALWAACTQNDRRLTYILLVTALDVLAEDEKIQNWANELKNIIDSMKDTIDKHPDSPKVEQTLLERLSRKLDEIGNPGMADRVRALVLRAFSFQDPRLPEAKELIREINKVLGRRGSLAHGGKFLELPTADENQRLLAIVAAALDAKLRDHRPGDPPPAQP